MTDTYFLSELLSLPEKFHVTDIYILSQFFVIAQYIFLIITYQLKNRKQILVFSFLSLIANGLAYILLSAYSGLAMVIIASIRNIIFMIDERKNGISTKNTIKDYMILALLYIISIASAVFTFDGFLSLMSVAGTMLYTYSVWQKNTTVYKILGLPVGILWIIYNLYVHSFFGFILEIALFIAALIGLIRDFKKTN